ncbi:MAG: hypothetical protein LQ352_001655 [Teloschistes flavicans]|nr:MAG: hypothetical protein LQ352_001655 [Teloschistes flavicans]
MAQNDTVHDVEELDLSESDTDALFASPSSRLKPKGLSKSIKSNPQEAVGQQKRYPKDGEFNDEEAREAALHKELAGIRTINKTIEGAIDGLERARGNMDVCSLSQCQKSSSIDQMVETVSHTVHDASTLLQTWTRILSQTEHNQRLILDPSWRGASQDLANIENESLLKQQEKQRRELEEAQRREARGRRAEEDERSKAENAGTKTTRAGRNRGRGTSRGAAASQSTGQSYSDSNARDTKSRVARAGNAIGRGLGSHRGRSRGT